MLSRFLIIMVLVSASVTAIVVRADETSSSPYSAKTVATLKSDILQQLTENFRQFNQPRIELGTIRLTGGTLPQKIQSVAFQGENSQGQAQFSVYGNGDQSAEVLANYSAWVEVRIAARRLSPGERLTNDAFTTEQVNVATGMPYQLRGVLIPKSQNLAQLETRQTILAGQYLVSNAIERVPDVRRGDSVRVRLITGTLSLSTLGTALEPGYAESQIKIETAKTHRELTGTLQPGGIVEVKL